MVFDTARNKMLFINLKAEDWGYYPTLEIWAWNNSGWSLAATTPVDNVYNYSKRKLGATYDVSRQRVVIVSLATNDDNYGNSNARVWDWDGAGLTPRTASGLPRSVTDFKIVYNSQRNKSLIIASPSARTGLALQYEWSGPDSGWSGLAINSSTPRFNLPAESFLTDLIALRNIPALPRVSRLPLREGFTAIYDQRLKQPLVWQASPPARGDILGDEYEVRSAAIASRWNGRAWESKAMYPPEGHSIIQSAFDPVRGMPLFFGANRTFTYDYNTDTTTVRYFTRTYEWTNSKLLTCNAQTLSHVIQGYVNEWYSPDDSIAFAYDTNRRVAMLALPLFDDGNQRRFATYQLARQSPTIDSFYLVLSDEVVSRGDTLQCIAAVAPDTFDSMEFWLDSNNSGAWEALSDARLGVGVQTLRGALWSLNVPIGSNWPVAATARVFAVGSVNEIAISSVQSATVSVVNAAPVVGGLVVRPTRIASISTAFQLQATGVSDPDGTVNRIDFYYDSDGSQTLSENDVPLGFVSSASQVLTVPGGLVSRIGSSSIFVVATDALGFSSAPFIGTITVNRPPDAFAPTSTISSVPPVASFTLSSTCTDIDGRIQTVEFWIDTVAPFGVITAADKKLGNGTKVVGTTSLYSLNFRRTATSGIAAGERSIYAVATDNERARTVSAPLLVNFQ
jgi:hypothetical protein